MKIQVKRVSTVTFVQVEECKLQSLLDYKPAYWATFFSVSISVLITSVVYVASCYPKFNVLSLCLSTALLSACFVTSIISAVCYFKGKKKLDLLIKDILASSETICYLGEESDNPIVLKKVANSV